MVKVILDFDGTLTDFQRAICAMDDEFDFYDSLFWEMDYGGIGTTHNTPFGDIGITIESDE